MKLSDMHGTGVPFWTWLGAVLLGPFLPMLLSKIEFARLFGLPLGIDNGLVDAFWGCGGWAMALIVSSAWLSICAGKAGNRGFLFLFLFVAGTLISLSWGYSACSLLGHLMN